MPPRNLQNRALSSSSSSSGVDGYGFYLVEDQDDREAPMQPMHALTCENLRAYSPTKQGMVRNISSVSTMSTMSPNSSQRNSPRILENRGEKDDVVEVQKNIVFVFENNRAPGNILISYHQHYRQSILTYPFLLSLQYHVVLLNPW